MTIFLPCNEAKTASASDGFIFERTLEVCQIFGVLVNWGKWILDSRAVARATLAHAKG